MREIQEKSKTLLCCYAREDQAMLHDLKNHLTALEKEGILDEQITYLQMLLKLQPDEPDAVVKLTTAMKNKRYIWKSEKVRQLIQDGNIQLAQPSLADLIEQVPQFPNIAMLTELLQKKIAEQKAEKIKLFIDQDRYTNAVPLLADMKNNPSNHSELLVPSLEEYLFFIAPLLNWGFGFGDGWYLILVGTLFSFIGGLGAIWSINTLNTPKKSAKQLFLEAHGLAPTQQTNPPTQRYRRTRR